MPWLVLILLVTTLALLVLCIRQAFQLRDLKNQWKTLFQNVDGENLERLLESHLLRSAEIESEIRDGKARLETLETKMRSSKRYVGLVRYDAFPEVGGSQSFSLAVYDEEGNGAVMTSQVGRQLARIFGKQLIGGKSDVSLTVEEQQAIEMAAMGKTRPRVNQ